MPRPTKEDIAEEQAKLDRFVLAITDSLTTLPTSDLRSWNFRAAVWHDLDHRIQGIIDSASGHEDCARMLLCLMVFRLVNLLLSGPLDVGNTDKQLAREAEERMAKAAATPKRAAGRPPGPKVERQYAGEYARRLAKMTPEQLKEFKAREAARIRDRRAKARLAPGS
jgi:hypothetical protein